MKDIKIFRRDRVLSSFKVIVDDNCAQLLYSDDHIEVIRYAMPKNLIGVFNELKQEIGQEVYHIESGKILLKTDGGDEVIEKGDVFMVDNTTKATPFKVLEDLTFICATTRNEFQKAKQEGESITKVMDSLQEKDGYTKEHCNRVKDFSMALAYELNVDSDQYHNILLAARMHDIGKIAVPDHILTKPAPLSESEYSTIQQHSQKGYDLIKHDFNKDIAQAILQHHERLDGSGYPNNLKDNEISIVAKIIGVCDSYDAMRTQRPYSKGKTREEAIDELLKHRDSKYDKRCVDAFLNVLEKHPEW